MRRLSYYAYYIYIFEHIQGEIVYKRLRIIIIMSIIILNRKHINISLIYKSVIDNIHNKTQLKRFRRKNIIKMCQ